MQINRFRETLRGGLRAMLLAGALTSTVGLASDAVGVTVTAPAGTFLGSEQAGVERYLAIPYARAPVGHFRWQPPGELKPFSEPMDARSYGPICPQPPWSGNTGLPQSEDCLSLNIWTPDSSPQAARPVMVWIHGGSFKVGSNRWWVTEASRLAARGLVVVSINYRLGLLGRFAHPALSAEQGEQTYANFGLMDQVMALRWVQSNIAHFGGDPDNVTVFGYSAGAVSVNFLMTMPSAKGLFQRGISQSSSVLLPKTRRMSEDLPGRRSLESEGLVAMEQLGLDSNVEAATLRALSVQQLLSYPLPPGSMNPVVDGGSVTEDLHRSFSTGALNASAYLIGVDSWEASLAKPMHAMPGPAYLGVLTRANGLTAQQVTETYGEGREPLAVGDEIFADGFHASSLWLARQAQKAGVSTYLYWFGYLPPAADELPGVPHGGEVPYVFGNLEHRERIGSPVITEQDRAFTEVIQSYWVNFARSGGPNGDALPQWHDLENGNDWMVLGKKSSMQPDLLRRRMALWLERYADD